MRIILLALFVIFIFSCSTITKHGKEMYSAKDYLLEYKSISKLVAINHHKLIGINGNIQTYKIYLNKLDNDSLTSIPYALDYIKTCISKNNKDRDSILLLFNIKFYTIVNRLSDFIYTKYNFLTIQLDNDFNKIELKS